MLKAAKFDFTTERTFSKHERSKRLPGFLEEGSEYVSLISALMSLAQSFGWVLIVCLDHILSVTAHPDPGDRLVDIFRRPSGLVA